MQKKSDKRKNTIDLPPNDITLEKFQMTVIN